MTKKPKPEVKVCPYCDKPFTGGRPERKYCGSEECLKAYQNAWARAKRSKLKKEALH